MRTTGRLRPRLLFIFLGRYAQNCKYFLQLSIETPHIPIPPALF